MTETTGTTRRAPRVGDEVTDGRTRAIVTDIRAGVIWLRAPYGCGEWPAEEPKRLKVSRTRAQRIEAGDA
ncbi:hypothetical protein AB0J25_29625 [Streptomyces sp. NPDC049910]|uniref:hypothetical protein n=1 Tax=Streptomyces sp. NPDC049910 TaxID=3155278 RepID=UPI00342B7D3F